MLFTPFCRQDDPGSAVPSRPPYWSVAQLGFEPGLPAFEVYVPPTTLLAPTGGTGPYEGDFPNLPGSLPGACL